MSFSEIRTNPNKIAYKTQCEECGKKLGDLYILPRGFRIICQKCYEDFKYRRNPNEMHYRLRGFGEKP